MDPLTLLAAGDILTAARALLMDPAHYLPRYGEPNGATSAYQPCSTFAPECRRWSLLGALRVAHYSITWGNTPAFRAARDLVDEASGTPNYVEAEWTHDEALDILALAIELAIAQAEQGAPA